MIELIPPANERDHHLGALDAPNVLVHYGDYECPDSTAAYPVIQELRKELGAGLCYIYRHFPLVHIHRHAEGAAEAAEAAHAQGRFWDMHDVLYANSPDLSSSAIVHYAREIGLDADRLARDLRRRLHAPHVRAGIESGRQSGVKGTPTFFINGVRHHGAADLHSLRDAVKIAR